HDSPWPQCRGLITVDSRATLGIVQYLASQALLVFLISTAGAEIDVDDAASLARTSQSDPSGVAFMIDREAIAQGIAQAATVLKTAAGIQALYGRLMNLFIDGQFQPFTQSLLIADWPVITR